MYLLKTSCITLILLELTFIVALGAFCPVFSKYGEQPTTPGAGLGEGFIKGGKVAIGVITTAIKGALLFT